MPTAAAHHGAGRRRLQAELGRTVVQLPWLPSVHLSVRLSCRLKHRCRLRNGGGELERHHYLVEFKCRELQVDIPHFARRMPADKEVTGPRFA